MYRHIMHFATSTCTVYLECIINILYLSSSLLELEAVVRNYINSIVVSMHGRCSLLIVSLMFGTLSQNLLFVDL